MRCIGKVDALLKRGVFAGQPKCFTSSANKGRGWKRLRYAMRRRLKRHLRLSCLAQSILQRTPTIASTSEQFAFAKGEKTFGQRCRAITREVFHSLISFAQRLFAGGYSCEHVAEAL